ncbi:MAG: helix-turn-helix domain-containing protein [Burkholderiaceae bacterium]
MGKHYEQLTAKERAAIMMMKASNCSARQIALALRRAPSTITCELKRFGAWPDRPMLTTPGLFSISATTGDGLFSTDTCLGQI